jgi:hypothetical protein
VLEVFERRWVPLNRERLSALDALERQAGTQPVPLKDILTAFIRPALLQAADPAQGGTAFARLMGRCLGEPNLGLEAELRRQLEPIRRRFDAALGRALPALTRAEIACRMHLVIGALHHELLVLDRRPPPHLVKKRNPTEIERRLVAFAAAGLQAEP